MSIIIKLIKGFVGLFSTILLVSLTIFTFQSCTNNLSDSNTNKNLAIENFTYHIEQNRNQLEQLNHKILDFESKDINYRADPALNFEMESTLKPIYQSSIELLHTYGFTDKDFEDENFKINDPRIIYMAFTIVEMENYLKSNQSFGSVFSSLCATDAYASEFWDCAKRAIGIEIAIELLRHRSMATISGRKLLIKTFTKIGARYLGWIGVGIATYDFVDCMFFD
ncbi:hypothetical protein [Balneola vulgaris]|uniref:hypothetical protein n=1 Tax=Balneola vulgaris TaxID=287535 RepID=UPI00036F7A9B|nr:hypothetical protein [Balneola vulgaris]